MVYIMKKEMHRVFDEKLGKWSVKRSNSKNPLNFYNQVEHADNFGEWYSEFDKSIFIKYDKDGNIVL